MATVFPLEEEMLMCFLLVLYVLRQQKVLHNYEMEPQGNMIFNIFL